MKYREIFFAYNGSGPWPCFFCSENVVIDEVYVHHKDHDDTHNDSDNLVATHRPCHSRNHALRAWEALDSEQRKSRWGPWVEARLIAGKKPKTTTQRQSTRVAQLAYWEGLSVEQRSKRGVRTKIGKIFSTARRSPGAFVNDFCFSCRQWLRHKRESCPRLALKFTQSCSCGVHTCYDAALSGGSFAGPDSAHTYTDFLS